MEATDEFFKKLWVIEGTQLNAVTKSTYIIVYLSKYTEKGQTKFNALAPDGSVMKDIDVLAINLMCYSDAGLKVYRAWGQDNEDSRQGFVNDLEHQNYHALYVSMKPAFSQQPKEPYALPPDEDWQWLGDGWYRR